MPIISSSYQAKSVFKNTHFATIFSAKIRRVKGVNQKRERITLYDGDFLDIDWSYSQSQQKNKVAVLFHGLEGNAQRPYMLALAKLLNNNGYDCAAVNLRGCSGEINKNFVSYHSGATDDVADVIEYIEKTKDYKECFLSGFSLGGNLILKYLGEDRKRPAFIKSAVAVSVPVSLYGSLNRLSTSENRIYSWSFLKDLRGKYKLKMNAFIDRTSAEDFKKMTSLRAFDELYTAPANGFENALDYYTKSSSLRFLSNIKIPTLLLNAKNDTFLDETCYPYEIADSNENFYLEVPEHGGHVGFFKPGEFYYSEQRTLKFFEENA